MKPLQTLLTIDSVGQRCISLEEGLERKNLSVIHKVDELPEEGQQGVIYYLQDTGEYIIFDNNDVLRNLNPVPISIITLSLPQDKGQLYFSNFFLEPNTLYIIPESRGLMPTISLLGNSLSEAKSYIFRLTCTQANPSITINSGIFHTSVVIPDSAAETLANLEEGHTYEFNIFANVLMVSDITKTT